MILRCTCEHEYQDEKYGKGMRVHNERAKDPKSPQEYRCTVCLKVRTAGGGVKWWG